MSLNPKYIQIAADDIRWNYEATPSALADMLTNPGTWIKDNVPQAELARNGSYFVVFSSLITGNGLIQISGIGGTSMITVEGFDTVAPTFANDFGLPEDPALFWDALDSVLQPLLESNSIEFIILPHEQRFFVHMQIAPNTAFVGMLLSAIAMDQQGYIDWLTSSTGTIPRSAKVMSKEGVESNFPVSEIRIVPKGTGDGGPEQPLDMFYETLTPGKCPEDYPVVVACSISEGMTVRQLEENGITYWVVEVDKVLVKMYCEKP